MGKGGKDNTNNGCLPARSLKVKNAVTYFLDGPMKDTPNIRVEKIITALDTHQYVTTNDSGLQRYG